MDPKLLSLLLYVPFLIVGIVTGVIFCLKGYKQGLWRALISLGISAVAIILSILLARLVGSLLSGVLFGFVPRETFTEMGAMEDLASQFVQGLISDVLAILFFALILLILLIVFKIVGNHIKTEELQPESKGYRWGGVGVRALDALLVSLLLLLPLYGTVATYVSPAAQVADKVTKKDSEWVELMNGLSDNALVTLYKGGPAAWVQGGLSGFTVGEMDVDLAEMASLLDEAMVRFERVQKAETEEETAEAIGELSDFLREEMIEEEFFYQLIHQIRSEAAKEVAKLPDGDEEKEFAEFFLDVADVSPEEFEDNGAALLDFISYAVRPEIISNLSEGNYSKLPAEFYDRFGSLLNHSEQAKALKKYFLTATLANDLFLDRPAETDRYSDGLDGTGSDARDRAEQAAWDRAEQFVANHWPTQALTAEQKQKEAKAFVIVFFESNTANSLETLARLPYFGADQAIPLLDDASVLRGFHYSENTVAYVRANPDCLQPLKDRLKVCQSTPLTDSSNLFDRYTDLLESKINFPQGFDDAQWDEILTNETANSRFPESGMGGGFASMGGISDGDGAQSGVVSSFRVYLQGDESAPVEEIFRSLTEPQVQLLVTQGFLELEDGRVLICEEHRFSYGGAPDGAGEGVSVEIKPLG